MLHLFEKFWRFVHDFACCVFAGKFWSHCSTCSDILPPLDKMTSEGKGMSGQPLTFELENQGWSELGQAYQSSRASLVSEGKFCPNHLQVFPEKLSSCCPPVLLLAEFVQEKARDSSQGSYQVRSWRVMIRVLKQECPCGLSAATGSCCGTVRRPWLEDGLILCREENWPISISSHYAEWARVSGSFLGIGHNYSHLWHPLSDWSLCSWWMARFGRTAAEVRLTWCCISDHTTIEAEWSERLQTPPGDSVCERELWVGPFWTQRTNKCDLVLLSNLERAEGILKLRLQCVILFWCVVSVISTRDHSLAFVRHTILTVRERMMNESFRRNPAWLFRDHIVTKRNTDLWHCSRENYWFPWQPFRHTPHEINNCRKNSSQIGVHESLHKSSFLCI